MSESIFPIDDIRKLIIEAIPGQIASPDVKLPYRYIPETHWKALHPDNALVEGIRGSGKSFWWKVLQDPRFRAIVGHFLPKTGIDKNTIVSAGFGEISSPDDFPGKDILSNLSSKHDSRQIWRTIIFYHVCKEAKKDIIANQDMWKDRIEYVINNPEKVEKTFYEIDQGLEEKKVYHLILFDALDRAADNWKTMRNLIRGLLQVLLEFKYYKRIRAKAYLRTDQISDPLVADFPDSSKLLSDKMELRWPRNELYGLLWQYLCNESQYGEEFRDGCNKLLEIKWNKYNNIWIVPKEAIEEKAQREIFNQIAGPWMGKDRRRGFPYTWLPNHLGDATDQVSPRSFLAAVRHAAEDSIKIEYEKYPLYYESIKRGVAEASRIRVRELKEDYPWVDKLMNPLSGMSVPCDIKEIKMRWTDSDTLGNLERQIENEELKLPPAHLTEGADGVIKDLIQLGIFRLMKDSRVNIPDVYRVGYNLGRRGGVKPVARY